MVGLSRRHLWQRTRKSIEGKKRDQVNRRGNKKERRIAMRVLEHLACDGGEEDSAKRARGTCQTRHAAHLGLRADVGGGHEQVGGIALVGARSERNDSNGEP